jgi:hypothetical protein
LIERGESALYSGLEAAYKELRDELLGLDSCNDGICLVDPKIDSDSTSDDDDIVPEIVEIPPVEEKSNESPKSEEDNKSVKDIKSDDEDIKSEEDSH